MTGISSSQLTQVIQSNIRFLSPHFETRTTPAFRCRVSPEGRLYSDTHKGALAEIKKTGTATKDGTLVVTLPTEEYITPEAYRVLILSTFLAQRQILRHIPSCCFLDCDTIPNPDFNLAAETIEGVYKRTRWIDFDDHPHSNMAKHHSVETMTQEERQSFVGQTCQLIEGTEKVERLQAKIQSMQDKVNGALAENPEAQAQMRAKLDLANAEASGIPNKIKAINKEIKGLSREKGAVNLCGGRRKAKKQAEIADFEGKIEAKNGEKIALETRLSQLQTQITAIGMELALSKQGPKATQADTRKLDVLKQELSTLNRTMEVLKERFNETFSAGNCLISKLGPIITLPPDQKVPYSSPGDTVVVPLNHIRK